MPMQLLRRAGLVLSLGAAFAAAPAVAAPPAKGAPAKGPVWTRHDGLLAGRFIEAFTARPEKIDSLIAGPGNFSRDHDLGFGHKLREAWVNPAGKLGWAFKVVYEGHRPISFEVKPVVNYAALRPSMDGLLNPLFGASGVHYWNMPAATAPLAADSLGHAAAPEADAAMRAALDFYMSPYSGIIYGTRGGKNSQLLENRDRFLGLADLLIPDKTRALYLLRSINPASRLTAAEFIVRHKAAFPDYEKLLATSLAHVFAHPSRAGTMRGDHPSDEDPRKLVFEYAKQEIRRDGRGVLRLY